MYSLFRISDISVSAFSVYTALFDLCEHHTRAARCNMTEQIISNVADSGNSGHVVISCDNHWILMKAGRSLIMQQWLCLTQGHPSCRGIIIDPERDPGEDGDQDGGHICLQDEISNVPLNPETQRKSWI